MGRASTLASAIFAFVLAASAPGLAQQTETSIANDAAIITTAPAQPGSSREVWFQRDLEDAQARSKRARNALIGSSVGFSVGLILAGIGASQCQVVSRFNQNDELVCNNAGNVLVPLGATFSVLGGIGMITSGIILGVSNKRKREIQRDMRRSYYGRRLQLDPASGGLVF